MSKTIKHELYKLRALLENDIVRIPPYIDTKKWTGKVTFDCYQNIIQSLSKLTTDKVLSDRVIKAIVHNIDYQLDMLTHYEDDGLQYLLFNDVIDKTNIYLEFAEDKELYEICHNIKRFKDCFGE